jgi:CRP/FNR family transcriptional regulator
MDLSIQKILRRLGLFQGLDEPALRAVAARLIPRHMSAGTILFQRGQLCRGVYILVSGEVEIYRTTSDGREQVILTEVPVKTIAELPLFDGAAYPASARTSQPSNLLFLSLDDFQRLYREHPEIADAVIQNLGRRLRHLVRVVERISLREVSGRVALALLDFAEQAGELRDGGSFQIPRTQTQLGAELATTRESVARALASFREHHVIDQAGRRVTILDLSALEDATSNGGNLNPFHR